VPFDINKQTFDVDRPLPEDFLLYARMDTHYLLYIYDCLKNDLLHRSNEQKNILMSVFQRSTQICLKVCGCCYQFTSNIFVNTAIEQTLQ